MAVDTVQYILKLKDELSPTLAKITRQSATLQKNLSVGGKRLSKNLGSAKKQVGGLRQSSLGLGSALSGLAPALGAAAIVGGLTSAVKAWDEQEQAIAQVRQGIQSTGGAAGRTLDQITKNAQNLQNQTIFGDETILKNVSSQLLTFTNIAGEQFDRTQQAVADVTTRLFGANASGEQLRSTSIQLGKALNDPIANLSALSRSGIQFTKSQKATIKSLQEGGRLAEAQTLILNELDKQYGGSAAAAAEAGLGGFKQLQNIIGDVGESIGGLLIPLLKAVIKPIKTVAVFIQQNFERIKDVFRPILSIFTPIEAAFTRIQEQLGGIGDAGSILEKVFNAIGNVLIFLEPLFVAIGEVIGEFIFQIVRVGQAIGDFVKRNERLQQIIKGIVSAGVAAFKQLAKTAKLALGGIGDLIVGVFTGDIEAIKEGLGKIGQTVLEGNTIAIGKAAFDGFKKGFEDKGSLADFFTPEKEAGGVGGIFGGLRQAAAGAGGGAPKATGTVAGDVAGATGSKLTNININIGKLIESLNINTTNLTDSAERVRDEMAKALLTAVNDVNISAAS